MDQVRTLIDTIIRLKRLSQAEVSNRSGVHPSNLSKFLNGETELRSGSLVEVLEALDIHLSAVLENQIEDLLGKRKSASMGEAMETLLGEVDPVAAKTIIETLEKRVKARSHPGVKTALNVVKDYKANLKSVRSFA